MNSTTTTITKRRRKALLPLACVLAVVGVLGAWFGIHSPTDVMAYRLMAQECHPVWSDFAARRFVSGDALEKLFAVHPPSWQRSLGDMTVCKFQPVRQAGVHSTSVRVTAVRGKLVRAEANSCDWGHTFFSSPEAAIASAPTLTEVHP